MKLNKAQNMLLGIAIGDAFGAGYEMQPRWKVLKYFTLKKYSRKKEWKKGKYTDDTQMSIAVAETMLEEFNKINLANKFIEAYKRDPHSGYTRGFTQVLKICDNGEDLLKLVKGDSIKNGAAMRAVPIGILPNLKDVIDYAKINAKITHNSPGGIFSSVCIAVASHYFYYNLGDPKKVLDFCLNICKDLDKEATSYIKDIKNMKDLNPKLLFGKKDLKFGVPCHGVKTTGAVLYILSRFSNSSKQTLIESVLLGGDTDSTACIALGIIAINQGLKELPSFLLKGLEDGKYGKNYLIQLGEKLFLKYRK